MTALVLEAVLDLVVRVAARGARRVGRRRAAVLLVVTIGAAAAALALAACNPYGMRFAVRCDGRGVTVEAHNPTVEAWDVRTDLDGEWRLVVPGDRITIRSAARPARVTVTTAGPSGQPDAVETFATGC